MNMHITATHQFPASRQTGFSLVEMMVGVAIGLIATVAIVQMMVSSESRKRTNASGSDAQISGVMGSFSMERDIRKAGHGFGTAPANIMGCTVAATVSGVAIAPAVRFFPVEIIQGAGGDPDQIVSFYGNSTFLTASQPFTGSTATTKTLQTRNGFQQGDLVVVAGNATAAMASANCDLVQITGNTAADGRSVEHTTATYINFYPGPPPPPPASLYNTAAGTGITYVGGTMFNLGNRPRRTVWSIDSNRTLVSQETLSGAAAIEVAEGVINLQAEYGVDSNGDGLITDGGGMPATPNEWVTTTPTNWTQVRAIRVAVLARSRQFERDEVTPAAPSWQGGDFTMVNLDGTPGTTAPANAADNWKNYRYRVYEKIIPIRNLIWGTAP